MWQQQDGGKADLYTWVHQTAGDDNGANPPKPINQGALAMGYYNMNTGDAPFFKQIADTYSSSDNYHQAVMGGTGANHIMLGSGDDAYYQNAQGQPTVPPANQIENPNPKPGTNNNYTQDGYSGGSYSNCSDRSQPGVGPIQNYIHSLPYAPFRNGDCAPGAYYLLNNYLPGYTLRVSFPVVHPILFHHKSPRRLPMSCQLET
ncbi:alkaline phosphatase family protein [Dictyobacter vulcani]|nr:alkaline phosphatase family protein [Dictyobacter vulcani]